MRYNSLSLVILTLVTFWEAIVYYITKSNNWLLHNALKAQHTGKQIYFQECLAL